MSTSEANPRRSYGSGSLQIRTDRRGAETWYGTWWVAGRRVKRRIGLKRATGSHDGLTRTQAEAEMRRMMALVKPASPGAAPSLTVRELSAAYREHLEAM